MDEYDKLKTMVQDMARANFIWGLITGIVIGYILFHFKQV